MKLWQKENDIDKEIEQFTVGNDRELDRVLASYDILGSLAHVKMLEECGLISGTDRREVVRGLVKLYQQSMINELEIEEGVEDIHSQVEMMLGKLIGESAKKIHTARSRNDQVMVDIRMYSRDQIAESVDLCQELFAVLMDQAKKTADIFMPGYTHMQVAMPSTYGLWFSSFAESLVDDLYLFDAVFKIINQNPLGSAAGYGSSFPINRSLTTQYLGFDDLVYNSIYAQAGRGKTEALVAMAMANLATTLGRLAHDLCTYNGQNFGFFKLPDAFTTGSSIMPHKKNPDVFELIRGKCNQIKVLPNEVLMLSSNLTTGYHREFQLLKESFFPAFQTIKDCIRLMIKSISVIEVNADLLNDKKYQVTFSVERINDYVSQGMSFRDAYHQVKEDIDKGEFSIGEIKKHSHEGSKDNLQLDMIRKKMDKVVGTFDFSYRHHLNDLLIP